MDYDHSCRTLTAVGTPDPFMVRAHGKYYFVSVPPCQAALGESESRES